MIKIEIIDSKVLKLLNSKREVSDKILAILKEQEKLEEEVNKLSAMHARTDEKVRPLITKLMIDVELKEYEQISRVGQSEDLKWYIEIADRMEEFKVAFKQEKEKNGNK